MLERRFDDGPQQQPQITTSFPGSLTFEIKGSPFRAGHFPVIVTLREFQALRGK